MLLLGPSGSVISLGLHMSQDVEVLGMQIKIFTANSMAIYHFLIEVDFLSGEY